MTLFTRYRSGLAVSLGTLGMLLAGGAGVRAQSTLSLVPSAVSDTMATFDVNLTGGTNLSGFDFNVALDPAYFSFTGSSPFVSGPANPFDTQLADALTDPSDLRVSYGQLGTAVSNPGQVTLGTFSVSILHPLPAAGTLITFSPIGDPNGSAGGSQVYDADGNNVLSSVTGARLPAAVPVPEASSVVSLALLLLLGAGGLAVRRRVHRGA